MISNILETIRRGDETTVSPFRDTVFNPTPTRNSVFNPTPTTPTTKVTPINLGRPMPKLPEKTQFLKETALTPSFPTQKIAKNVMKGMTKKQPTSYQKLTGNIAGILNLGTKTTEYGGNTKYEKFHPGIDVANVMGTPIPSTIEGTVAQVITGKKQGDKGFGNQVVIIDSQGNKHKFSHLNTITTKVGQKVKSGEIIATMGNSGSTYSPSGTGTGTHLDYRIENAVVDAYNKYINPYTYFNKLT